ncbi:hypothetical protein ABK040_004944 [Willaertia magna]
MLKQLLEKVAKNKKLPIGTVTNACTTTTTTNSLAAINPTNPTNQINQINPNTNNITIHNNKIAIPTIIKPLEHFPIFIEETTAKTFTKKQKRQHLKFNNGFCILTKHLNKGISKRDILQNNLQNNLKNNLQKFEKNVPLFKNYVDPIKDILSTFKNLSLQNTLQKKLQNNLQNTLQNENLLFHYNLELVIYNWESKLQLLNFENNLKKCYTLKQFFIKLNDLFTNKESEFYNLNNKLHLCFTNSLFLEIIKTIKSPLYIEMLNSFKNENYNGELILSNILPNLVYKYDPKINQEVIKKQLEYLKQQE